MLGGTWICQGISPPDVYLANDRIIAKWQIYVGRFDEKTVASYLSTLRYCEDVTDGKSFEVFSISDAEKVRNDLKRRVRKDAQDTLSTSTVRHRASHLRTFFEWLLKQDEGAKLAKDLPDYFELPKAAFAAALPRAIKKYPTIEEAEQLLEEMPQDRFSTAIGSFLCDPINDSYAKTSRSSPVWGGTLPLFVIGGGRHYEGYSGAFSEVERLISESLFRTSFSKIELDLSE